MKKIIVFIIGIMILMTSAVNADSIKIGDVINSVLAADIIAYIDGLPINSYNIDGNTAVIVEELDKYGFDITWDEMSRILTVERNVYKTVTGGNYEHSGDPVNVGTPFMDVYYTDIRTYLNGCLCDSYNVGGKTIIYLDDLNAIYGNGYNWNDASKTLSLLLDDTVHITDLPKRPNSIIFEVLKNKKKLITESGKQLYINDFFNNEVTFDGDFDTHVKEYTVVDFDGDGNYEIVASIQYQPNPSYFTFVVLHFNGQNVYGYWYGIRQMSIIKTDGSYCGSGGAAISIYLRLSFENDRRNEEVLAVKDYDRGFYELYGQKSSAEEVNQFVNNWNKKEDVEWVKWDP